MLKALKQVRAAFSMLNPDEVKSRAEHQLSVVLSARDDAGYAAMEDLLVPDATPRGMRVAARAMLHRADQPARRKSYDLVLCDEGVACPSGGFTLYRSNPAATIAAIVRHRDDIALALARNFLVFRQPVVERVVHAVSRENALFAITTALPNVVPSLMELPWAMGEFASDTVFLTVNQVRMAFLIAAACGKEVGVAAQKIELASIAAGAFGWRTLARELAGKIPLGGGLIPKGAIAYAGTFVVGKGLEKYHHAGAFHTRDEHRAIYREAYHRGTEIAQNAIEVRG